MYNLDGHVQLTYIDLHDRLSKLDSVVWKHPMSDIFGT